MKRRRVNFLTALALLLLAGSVTLWLRSHVVSDYVGWQRATGQGLHTEREFLATSSRGRLVLHCLRSSVPTFDSAELQEQGDPVRVPTGFRWTVAALRRVPAPDGLLGFGWEGDRLPTYFRFAGRHQKGWTEQFTLAVPYWAFAAPAAAVVAGAARASLRSRRIGRRRRLGLCPHCGYDLRASSGRCPECGNRPEVSSAG